MKGFLCGACKYISINGSAPDLCPVCGSPKSVFSEQDIIKTAQDEGPGEKHVPLIEVNRQCGLMGDGCTDVHVKIGKIAHPMEAKHYIVFVDLYAGNEWVSRAHLSPNTQPAACFHIKASSGKITAIELCNIHGHWINEGDL